MAALPGRDKEYRTVDVPAQDHLLIALAPLKLRAPMVGSTPRDAAKCTTTKLVLRTPLLNSPM